MKRIISACLEQTLHFQLKEELEHTTAAKLAREEVEHYKMQLQRSHIRYQIVEETVQENDSILLKVKKQYNNHDTGDYIA